MVRAKEEIRDELLPEAQEAGARFLMLASRIMARGRPMLNRRKFSPPVPKVCP